MEQEGMASEASLRWQDYTPAILSMVMCALVGLLTAVYYILSRKVAVVPPAVPSSAVPPPPSKHETFVTTLVHQHPLVLFTFGSDTPVLKLCQRNQLPIHLVDLDRVAGKRAVADALQDIANTSSLATEWLFVNAVCLGDTDAVIRLARSGDLATRLGCAIIEEDEAAEETTTFELPRHMATSVLTASLPLTLAEFIGWKPARGASSTVPRADRPRADNLNRSRLVVFLPPASSSDPSTLLLPWNVIDTLIVHAPQALLSLPTAAWVDAAHRNGVRVVASLTWQTDEPVVPEILATHMQHVQSTLSFDGWFLTCPIAHATTLVPHLEPCCVVLLGMPTADLVSTAIPLLPQLHGLVVTQHASDTKVVHACAKAAGHHHWKLHFGVDAPAAARVLRFADVSLWLSHTACLDPFWPRNWRPLGPASHSHGGDHTFYTAFNTGAGQSTSIRGRVVSATPWHDIGQQDVLPTLGIAGAIHAAYTTDRAFHGGTSLHLTASLQPKERASLELVKTHIRFEPFKVIHVAYTFQSADAAAFGLVLTLTSHEEIVLRGRSGDTPASSAISPLIGRAKKSFVYGAVSDDDVDGSGWTTRVFRLGGALWDGKLVRAISVFAINLLPDQVSALSGSVGQVVVARAADMPRDAPVLRVRVDVHNAALEWTPLVLPSTVASTHIFQEHSDDSTTWLTRTNDTQWAIPSTMLAHRSIVFVLQAVDWTGAVGPRQRVAVVVSP
ncbi:Aste57867_273 [Aphanomyces stellatus]|uniref:Aste57867_273 protein n=1 Tax=Aphanomyces stellatus TaxID=120398 RepID=A0A485K6C1_9STRA|nr:hypothetical protein As57867_000273 [Aphanomyces stellatus]VFT77499.1 Aste57867_273 [Aphanomyces stellatus]